MDTTIQQTTMSYSSDAAPAPSKQKREKSEMRKITSALDKEVAKVEANKVKITKLEKAISESQTAIRELSAKLSRL